MDERLRRAGRRAATALRTMRRPALNLALAWLAVQVVYSQSRTVQSTWARAQRHIPDPVLSAADAVAETAVGRAVSRANAGVHAGANWVFHPFRATVAAHDERARATAESAAEYRRRVREAEQTSPRGPQRVIAESEGR